MSNFLWPKDCSMPGSSVLHYLQEECPLNQWCYLATSSPNIPFSFCLQSFPASDSFPISPSHQVAKVLEFQLQHQSFQWIVKVDFQYNWLVWYPCSTRDSQESSPTQQFKNINSSALSLLHRPTLTSIRDHGKNHSLD